MQLRDPGGDEIPDLSEFSAREVGQKLHVVVVLGFNEVLGANRGLFGLGVFRWQWGPREVVVEQLLVSTEGVGIEHVYVVK